MTATQSRPESLEARYAEVCERVGAAAVRSGRRAQDVILVAVTKTADPEQIRSLLQLGHRDFGENRVQQLVQRAAMVDEYLNRQRLLPSNRRVRQDQAAETLFPMGTSEQLRPEPGSKDGVRWHMIGHLQRNKARKVVEFVRLIHSVDSLRLAEELQTIALKRDKVIEILLEVNCSGEANKKGCPMPAAMPLAEQIETMVNIRLRGVMTMAPYSENPEEARSTFARCRELYEEMKTMGLADPAGFNILSMGMSGDYEVAISEGANIVRVGSAIFGEKEDAPVPEEQPEPEEEGEEEPA